MKIAVQMDPLENLNPLKDSTFMLIREALRRKFEVFFYTPDQLFWEDGGVYALARGLHLGEENLSAAPQLPQESLRTEQEHVRLNLAAMDVVLIRQDPPYDMHYLTATYLLEQLPPSVKVLNHPSSIRRFPEKIGVTRFRAFLPPTLITHDRQTVEAFLKEHGTLVLKPLFGNGGAGIFKVDADDPNRKSLLDLFLNQRDFFVAQKFIPQVSAGDKRILFIDGEPIGLVNRIPQKGQILSNLSQGGVAAQAAFSEKDRTICEALKPFLKQYGLFFVGIDVIDGFLTEINVTSPTGLKDLALLEGVRGDILFWDALR